MCDKCGKECCRVVITKQGERGPQGPVGPPGRPGTNADINAANVTSAAGLGWWKDKVAGVLRFFSVRGSTSIGVAQVSDDIQFSINNATIVDHVMVDGDITSDVLTINSVASKTYSHKDLYNKMIYFTHTISINADFIGVNGTFSLNLICANLPVDIASTDLDIAYLQLSGVTQELLNIRAQANGSTITFSRSDFAFTNGNNYDIYISYSGIKPIN